MQPRPDRLFRRFRDRGDARALARVFDLTAPKLLGIARHLTPDAARAEDLVQATFVVAIERAASWDGERELVPWLVGILAHQARATHRRETRTPEPERLPERDPQASEPARSAQQSELRAAVDAAVGDLPEVYRPVLALYLADGSKPSEIAGELGRAPGTVRVQIHRGLALLRKALPAGFATGALATLAQGAAPRGLAAIKQALFTETLGSSAAAASAVTAPGLIGGVWMGKNAILAGAAAVLAGAGWFVWSELERPPRTPDAPAAVAAPSPVSAARAGDTPGSGQGVAPAPAPDGRAQRTAAVAEAVAEPAPAAATKAAARPFELTGRVRDSATSAWVGDAEVVLGGRGPDGAWRTVRSRTTADGRYGFAAVDLEPGSLSAHKDGYAPSYAPRLASEALERARGGRPLDAGVIELRPGALVSGRVLDARGGALDGASVHLVYHYYGYRSTRGSNDHVSRVAQSDADGRFDLTERLAFMGESKLEYVFCAITPDGLGWTGIELLAGGDDARDVEVRLQPGAALELLVEDAEGRPVSGAEVRLRPRFEPFHAVGGFDADSWHGGAEELAALFAGRTEDGRALFEHLPQWVPGATRLFAEEQEYDAGNPYEVTVISDAGTWTEELRLEFARNTHTVRIGRRPVRALVGRVLDSAGDGIAGAEVRAQDVVARSFSDGSFRLDGLATHERELEVTADAAGFSPREIEVEWPAELVGLEGSEFAVDISMAREARLAGTVRNENGEPIEGALLFLERPVGHAQRGDRQRTESGPDGAFAFARAAEGPWHLNAWPPPPDPAAELASGRAGTFAEFEGVRSTIVMGGEEDIEVVLKRAPPGRCRLEARVVDAASGLPLEPRFTRLVALFERRPDQPTPVAPTPVRTVDGVTADALRPGRYRLWVRTDERPAGHADVEVGPNDTLVRATVAVGGPASLAGRVVLDAEIDPAHVRIGLQFSESSTGMVWGDDWKTDALWHAMVEPNPDGSFEIENVWPGTYVVRVHHFALFGEQRVRLEPDARTEVTLEPGPAAVLIVAGTVSSAGSGTGSSGAFGSKEPEQERHVFIEVENVSAGWRSGTYWSRIADGRFEQFIVAPPGRLRWRVSYSVESSPWRPADVERDGEAFGRAGERSEVRVHL